MDGWGIGSADNTNAIYLAKTPNYETLIEKYPFTKLKASGKYVGLDNNQISGSETGHMNIGAGRIVEQDSRFISESINSGQFFRNPVLVGAMKHVQKYKSKLHFIGLLGDEDSPHMSPYHVHALQVLAKDSGVKDYFFHFFTDGRDSYARSALDHIKNWEKQRSTIGAGKISTLIGRFYAMDRVKNWDRLKKAYALMVLGKGKRFNDPKKAIQYWYRKGMTDEYIEPSVIKDQDNSKAGLISDNDAVIFFNLRSDRARQLSKLFVLSQSSETKMPMPRLKNLYFVAMTDFGPDLPVHTAFSSSKQIGTIPVVFRHRRQLYISETEKFAHVTYFLNGGFADPIAGEDRVMISSPSVDNYAKVPEMSAIKITDYIIRDVKKGRHDFIVVNFANADMVGHSGDMHATIKAVEAVDKCIGKLIKLTELFNGYCFVTADHGNADCMWDTKTNMAMTFHTVNPVPFIIYNRNLKGKRLRAGGVLGNIAPTMCDVLNVEKTQEMNQNSLLCN